MYLTEDRMPGATPEVRAVQFRQMELCHKMYAEWNEARKTHSDEDATKTPKVVAAKAAYDATVDELELMLGKDALCGHVDYNLANLFSEAYKSLTGFRPRGLQFSRQQVNEWLTVNHMMPAGA